MDELLVACVARRTDLRSLAARRSHATRPLRGEVCGLLRRRKGYFVDHISEYLKVAEVVQVFQQDNAWM